MGTAGVGGRAEALSYWSDTHGSLRPRWEGLKASGRADGWGSAAVWPVLTCPPWAPSWPTAPAPLGAARPRPQTPGGHPGSRSQNVSSERQGLADSFPALGSWGVSEPRHRNVCPPPATLAAGPGVQCGKLAASWPGNKPGHPTPSLPYSLPPCCLLPGGSGHSQRHPNDRLISWVGGEVQTIGSSDHMGPHRCTDGSPSHPALCHLLQCNIYNTAKPTSRSFMPPSNKQFLNPLHPGDRLHPGMEKGSIRASGWVDTPRLMHTTRKNGGSDRKTGLAFVIGRWERQHLCEWIFFLFKFFFFLQQF